MSAATEGRADATARVDKTGSERKLLTDEIAAMVGRTARYTAPEPFGAAEFRYFAVAIGDHNPVYFDDHAARAAGYAGVTAPPTFVTETNQYMPGEVDDHGYGGHHWHIEVPNTRMIRGGHDYEFHQPLSVGDVLTVDWSILDVSERTSRGGAQLLRVLSEARYSNQHGNLLAVNRETLIFQELL